MTEFEINKKVAEKLGVTQYLFIAEDVGKLIWNVPSNKICNGFVSSKGNLFDPCNNAEQAWEIMMKYNICVTKSKGKYVSFYNLEFENSDDGYVPDIETQNAKPLVAAMLVFLEI